MRVGGERKKSHSPQTNEWERVERVWTAMSEEVEGPGCTRVTNHDERRESERNLSTRVWRRSLLIEAPGVGDHWKPAHGGGRSSALGVAGLHVCTEMRGTTAVERRSTLGQGTTRYGWRKGRSGTTGMCDRPGCTLTLEKRGGVVRPYAKKKPPRCRRKCRDEMVLASGCLIAF